MSNTGSLANGGTVLTMELSELEDEEAEEVDSKGGALSGAEVGLP